MSLWKGSFGSLCGALAVLGAGGVQAQQAESDSPQAGAVEPASDEAIVVTAQRRATDLLDSPLAASVLSGDDLEDRQVTNLDALQFATPSLSVSNFGQGNLLNIRGIGRSEVVTQASAGVPIYRDGVATFNAYFASAEPYFDIASVQVLRGPQGTFAGQNSTGGAIFVTTRDPELAAVSGYGQLQIGSYDQIAGQAVLNVPIGDTLAFRIGGDAEARDGFYNYSGQFTGDPDRVRRAAGRLGLLWQPSSAFRAVFKVDYNHHDSGANTYAPIASPDDLFDVASDEDLFAVDEFVRTTANLSYVFGDGAILRSITGYQHGVTRQRSDSDGTALPIAALEYRATEEIVSQEINYISPDDRRLRYVLGAYYSDSNVGLPLFLVEAPPVEIEINSRLKRGNAALFGHVVFDLAPQLSVEAGARYNRATVEQDLLTTVRFGGFPLSTTPGPAGLPTQERVTGKVGLSWHPAPDHLIYGFVATGDKNAGLNVNASGPPSFDHERLTAYEAGYKLSLLDRRLRVQLGYFHYDYRDYQLSQFDPLTRQSVISNVPGRTGSDGFEAQIDGRFGGTAFNLAASYITSELPRFFSVDPRFPPPLGSPACPADGPSTTPQCRDLTGQRLPFQPRHTLSAGIEHRVETRRGSFTPRVDVGYVGPQFTTVFQTPVLDTLESRTIVNASVNYRSGPWGATLFATNLLDEEYIVAKLSGLRVAGLPQQFGLRVGRSF